MVESIEKRRVLYFKISVAIAAVAGVPIYLLTNYFFYSYRYEHDWLTGEFGRYWVNLLVYPEITSYLVLLAIITAVLGIMGVLWARIAWLAVLGEFLCIFLNILIFRASADGDWRILDPMNIAGIVLLICSISFALSSLGIRKMSYEPATDTLIWGTAAFFVLGIIMLVGIMLPLGLRTAYAIPEITLSFLFFWGAKVSPVTGALIMSSKLLLVILFSLGIVALLRKWKYGHLYASLVLFLFGLRWLEMIVPVFHNSMQFLGGVYSDPDFGFTYGLFYKILFAIGRFLGEKILTVAAMAIPSLVSFLLGFLFLFRIDKKTPEKG